MGDLELMLTDRYDSEYSSELCIIHSGNEANYLEQAYARKWRVRL